jgi:hypothetical protein
MAAATRARRVNGANKFRIAVAQKSGASFQAPTLFAQMEASEDRVPVTTADELTLYFASYGPPPGGGTSKRYLYRATRTSLGANFAASAYVTELNAVGKDTTPSWISKDECTIFLTSDRNGNFDIFYATRPK